MGVRVSEKRKKVKRCREDIQGEEWPLGHSHDGGFCTMTFCVESLMNINSLTHRPVQVLTKEQFEFRCYFSH